MRVKRVRNTQFFINMSKISWFFVLTAQISPVEVSTMVITNCIISLSSGKKIYKITVSFFWLFCFYPPKNSLTVTALRIMAVTSAATAAISVWRIFLTPMLPKYMVTA